MASQIRFTLFLQTTFQVFLFLLLIIFIIICIHWCKRFKRTTKGSSPTVSIVSTTTNNNGRNFHFNRMIIIKNYIFLIITTRLRHDHAKIRSCFVAAVLRKTIPPPVFIRVVCHISHKKLNKHDKKQGIVNIPLFFFCFGIRIFSSDSVFLIIFFQPPHTATQKPAVIYLVAE